MQFPIPGIVNNQPTETLRCSTTSNSLVANSTCISTGSFGIRFNSFSSAATDSRASVEPGNNIAWFPPSPGTAHPDSQWNPWAPSRITRAPSK